ncbi:hypothetical protein HZB93_03685 [Candidatus Falkowbacteria bacterium]|nr:hypothetical protein [Candidatus Falkowbacteria bacterium]
MKSKSIYIITIVLAIILAGFLYFIIKSNNKEIELPKINFDAEAQLPNANINFKYPKEGFYKLGINLTDLATSETLISGIHIEPTAEFDRNAQSAYVVEEIKLLKNEKNFKNMEELESFYKTDFSLSEFEREYAKENGHILDINDNKYFIYKVTEDATVWHALTIAEEGVIEVSLAYTNGFTPYSENIYKNNDGLFLEILENINPR